MVSGIKLSPDLMRAIEEMGYKEWTDIQLKSIPLIQKGRDIIGQSATGSGKTAAFGLPILEKVEHGKGIQALILVPTRELCEQVYGDMAKFSKHRKVSIQTVYGGVSINTQIHGLRFADIVVGTPGRLLDHLERRTIDLSKVKILVLDEADRMFDMGFIDDVRDIISRTPNERQTMLFSATISDQVYFIVQRYMKNPENIKVKSYVDDTKMDQCYYDVDSEQKFSLLIHLLKQEEKGLTMIFCATRIRVDELSKSLYKQGLDAEALHGGLTQNRRQQVMERFHSNKIGILVASDLAARGLDIKNVKLVVNYDIPNTSKEYIHRIGRTARAGANGKVISLVSRRDHANFSDVLRDKSLVIEKKQAPNYTEVDIPRMDLPRSFGRGQRSFSRPGFRSGPRFGGSRGGFRSSGPRFGGSRGGFRSSGPPREGGSREGGFGSSREESRSSDTPREGFGQRSQGTTERHRAFKPKWESRRPQRKVRRGPRRY